MSYTLRIGVGEAGRSDGYWAALGGFFLSFSFSFALFLRWRVLRGLARLTQFWLTQFCLNQNSSDRLFLIALGKQRAAGAMGSDRRGFADDRILRQARRA